MLDEVLPAFETRLNVVTYPVSPGDSITASLVCLTNCQPNALQTWRLSMRNATRNWTFTTTISYRSSLASVEWIQEAPSSSGGTLPLAKFEKVTFNPAGASLNIRNSGFGSIGLNSITMINDYGQTSMPSALDRLGQFSTCWGSNMASFAACAAP